MKQTPIHLNRKFVLLFKRKHTAEARVTSDVDPVRTLIVDA